MLLFTPMEQTPPPPCCCLKKLQLLMNIGSGRAGSMFLCSLSSTASRAVSCSLFQGWGLRHTFQVAYVCSFLFQAVFWLISSRDQAVVPAPKLPISTQGVILSLHTWRLPKRPVLCHNEESVNLFTYTLCSSVFSVSE